MYEDLNDDHLKKGEEDEDNEDSGTWSYSYPSYSRFTFTGKTKSRLGRSHSRLNQPITGRENSTRVKGSNVNSGLTDVDNFNMGFSSQEPKTPGMSWLQKDKLSSYNFTPGSNLFRQSTVGHDSQISCNDSGVDVSSQSNFMSTLKNDSIQNSLSCKRNLAFNTPFKLTENKQESSLKELNHLLHQNSFPKLKFTTEKSYENKENAITEEISGQETVKESVAYNVFNNKPKQTSSRGCDLFSSVAIDDNALKLGNREQLLGDPNKPASATDDQKFDDEPSDAPIDLSSGKGLTHENIFSRSFQIEREQNSDQPKETTKEIVNKEETSISKEKSSSDGLSSILPTFLAPVNKTKSNEVVTNTVNALPGNIASVEKASATSLPVLQPGIPKPTQQVRNSAGSWFSSSILGTNSSKPSSSAGELKHIPNHLSNVPETNFLRKNKDILLSNKDPNENFATKNYDQLSAIINLSNCVNDKNLSPLLSNELSKTKPEPHFQLLDQLSESNKFKISPNIEHNSKSLVVEDKMKTLSVNSKTIGDYKSGPMATINSVVSNTSESQPPNGHARVTHHLNYNSKKPIPLSFNHENISLKKSPPTQLSCDSQAHISSEKTIEPQKSFNDRNEGAKGSTLPNQEQLASVNQNHFSTSNEPRIQQGLGIGQQQTYLAPQQSSDHRISNDFPHVKPDAPQLLNNRLNCQALKKPQSFKMSAPRGLLSRSNTELYVNGQVYTTLSMLGRGGSSEVYQVIDQRTSKLMAIKCVDLSMVDKTIAEGYLNEIDLLSKLQGCSSVIRMFDYEYVQEYKMLYVVMEKGDTDLSQLIRDISKTKKISMSMIIYYWTEMLTAVRDIHEKGIIHSDLKPANFLLVSGRLKLIDFGIASSQGDMTSVFKEVTTGTWNYMSPEAIKNTSASAKGFKITYKSDVWSLGCILYNLLYGKTPFSHITSTWSKLQAIADPNHQVEFPQVGAPLVLAEALQSCLRREPKLRPTVAELLALPYHASGDSRHLGPQLRSILPHEWWTKISHLFEEVKVTEDDKNGNGNTS